MCGHRLSFTRLHADIVEQDGAFTVRVRLLHHLKQEDNAWGGGIARSFEMARLMIERLATRFEIDRSWISIKIVMRSFSDGTIH
jgi:hypothetical protein